MANIQTVLLVDDAIAMRKIGAKSLEQHGISVLTAADGYEALTVLKKEKPDAIFIDVEMPNLDGLKLTAILRESKLYSRAPIALLTSASTAFDRQKGLLAGADFYLTKPFSADTISNALSSMQRLLEDC